MPSKEDPLRMFESKCWGMTGSFQNLGDSFDDGDDEGDVHPGVHLLTPQSQHFTVVIIILDGEG